MRSAKRRFKNVFFLFFYFKTLSIHFFLYVLCYKTKRVTVSKYLGPVLYSFVEKKKTASYTDRPLPLTENKKIRLQTIHEKDKKNNQKSENTPFKFRTRMLKPLPTTEQRLGASQSAPLKRQLVAEHVRHSRARGHV